MLFQYLKPTFLIDESQNFSLSIRLPIYFKTKLNFVLFFKKGFKALHHVPSIDGAQPFKQKMETIF
jgi:hypothetical protein